jgi:hypothetical protein
MRWLARLLPAVNGMVSSAKDFDEKKADHSRLFQSASAFGATESARCTGDDEPVGDARTNTCLGSLERPAAAPNKPWLADQPAGIALSKGRRD